MTLESPQITEYIEANSGSHPFKKDRIGPFHSVSVTNLGVSNSEPH
jgi:hypothetical protein